MEERGLRHREEVSFVTSLPKREHKAAVDPAQSILNLGFLMSCFGKNLKYI